jgi:hypothetical protein
MKALPLEIAVPNCKLRLHSGPWTQADPIALVPFTPELAFEVFGQAALRKGFSPLSLNGSQDYRAVRTIFSGVHLSWFGIAQPDSALGINFQGRHIGKFPQWRTKSRPLDERSVHLEACFC